MATMAARAQRNGLVRGELEDLLDRVAARLGLEVPPPAPYMRDPQLQPIVELERFRDMMRSIDVALESLHSEGEAPAGREEWSMQMLRDFAKEQGIKIPSDANHRKADLVAYLDTLDYDEEGNLVQRDEVDDDTGTPSTSEEDKASEDAAPSGAPASDRPPLSEVVEPASAGTSLFDDQGREIVVTSPSADVDALKEPAEDVGGMSTFSEAGE